MIRRAPNSVTIATVAKEAGVAPTTVSCILNGKAQDLGLAERTVQRVLAIADRLHYLPNETARSLRRQRSATVGVLFPHLRDEWADRVVAGMREVLDPADYVPLIAVHRFNTEWERSEIKALLERRIEALICMPLTEDAERYEQVVNRGVPLIFLGDTLESTPRANYVAWDTEAAARRAVRCLIEAGRRRVAFLGWGLRRPFITARYLAYRQTLKEAGLELRDEWAAFFPLDESPAFQSEEIIVSAIQRMFDRNRRRPDAVFASSDMLNIEALKALRNIGLRIPEDVAMATLSAQPLLAHLLFGVSVVPVPTLELGREVARVALELLSHPENAPIQRVVPCGEPQAGRAREEKEQGITREWGGQKLSRDSQS
ncbi:MAG: LacI family DNA-binding transcriptional regulator [Candidatus Sumerlaeota bacterium]|nr:LacI family DNA-binding transcriptional regulator [Candidatus Sumerlaeota bacterium]